MGGSLIFSDFLNARDMLPEKPISDLANTPNIVPTQWFFVGFINYNIYPPPDTIAVRNITEFDRSVIRRVKF